MECVILAECKPVVINLGSERMMNAKVVADSKRIGAKLKNDISLTNIMQDGDVTTKGNNFSPVYCFTRIKFDTKSVCLGDICHDVRLSKVVEECISV